MNMFGSVITGGSAGGATDADITAAIDALKDGVDPAGDTLAELLAIGNSKADASHTHAQSDVTNLVSDLAGKAASSHTHAQSDVTNLVSDLAGKAASSHTHAQSDVTNLVSDLAGKAASSHTHAQSDVTNLVSDLAGKAASSHTHAQSDVTNLVSDLAGKAASSHTHAQSDVTNLVSDLAGKAASSHTHAQSDVTNLVSDLSAKEPAQTAASQAEAETGTEAAIRSFSPLRVAQAIAKLQAKPRVQIVASAATITPDADSDDVVVVTALAVNATIANPTGTPSDSQSLMIRMKDNGSSRTLTFGSQYRAIGTTLPAATTASKLKYLGFIWNGMDVKWDLVATTTEA